MMTLNNNEKDFQKKMQYGYSEKSTKGSIPLDENRRQGSRRYGSSTGGWIYILCNQSSNGKEYPGCRRAF